MCDIVNAYRGMTTVLARLNRGRPRRDFTTRRRNIRDTDLVHLSRNPAYSVYVCVCVCVCVDGVAKGSWEETEWMYNQGLARQTSMSSDGKRWHL